MLGLTNKYLEKLCKKTCGKNFVGVYPCDIKPKIKRRHTFSVIFNTDPHFKEGDHFVAIFCDKRNIFYFDSYGEECNNQYIRDFVNEHKLGRHYSHNERTIQSDTSIFCGFFCLSFILAQMKNISLTRYQEIFNPTNLNINDQIVINLITSLLQNKFIDQ